MTQDESFEEFLHRQKTDWLASDLAGFRQIFEKLAHFNQHAVCVDELILTLATVDTGLGKDVFFELFGEEPNIRRACYYLFIAFHGQTREDRPRENTAVHSLRVATAVAQRLGKDGKQTIIKALLHDVIEDCGPEHRRLIKDIFGDDILAGVERLSLPSSWERWTIYKDVIPADVIPGNIRHEAVTPDIYASEAWESIRSHLKKQAKEQQLKDLTTDEIIIKAEDNLDALRSYCIDFESGRKALPEQKIAGFLKKLADRGDHHRAYMQRLKTGSLPWDYNTVNLATDIDQELFDLEKRLVAILKDKGIGIEVGHVSGRSTSATRPAYHPGDIIAAPAIAG